MTTATDLKVDTLLLAPQPVLPLGNSKLLPVVLLLLLPLLPLLLDTDTEPTQDMLILLVWQPPVWQPRHHLRVCLLWVVMAALAALHHPHLLLMGRLLHLPATSPRLRLPLREQLSSSAEQ
jgi:hypothetical protein